MNSGGRDIPCSEAKSGRFGDMCGRDSVKSSCPVTCGACAGGMGDAEKWGKGGGSSSERRRRRRKPEPTTTTTTEPPASMALLGQNFIEAATEAQVAQCTGGALLAEIAAEVQSSRRRSKRRRRRKSFKSKSSRRRSKRRRRRRRSKESRRRSKPKKPAVKPTRCLLYFGSSG